MKYWLVKSEPSAYSWEQLLKDKKTAWTGVRNYAARLNLRAMKKRDMVLFYHSNEGLCIVGIARVIKEAYQDPTTREDWSAVDIEPVKTFKKPVELVTMKKDKQLEKMELIRISRLSVSKVTEAEFNRIYELGN